jgi:hypothetical protein
VTLTVDMIRETLRLLREAPAAGYGPMRVIFSPYALETTQERLFPESKHRSRRIHKKLVKRFGGEFRQVPAMWRVGDELIAHPSFKARLEAAIPLTDPPDRRPSPFLIGLDAMRLRYGPGYYPDYPHRYAFERRNLFTITGS